jgi:hypothetical protein
MRRSRDRAVLSIAGGRVQDVQTVDDLAAAPRDLGEGGGELDRCERPHGQPAIQGDRREHRQECEDGDGPVGATVAFVGIVYSLLFLVAQFGSRPSARTRSTRPSGRPSPRPNQAIHNGGKRDPEMTSVTPSRRELEDNRR